MRIVSLLVVFLVFSLLVVGCSSSTIRQADSSDSSVYDRVMKRGVIRCGYVIYNPGCMKDPNTGKMYGIGPDVFEMAAKNLGLKVEWTEEVGFGSMIEGLQTNRYDIVVSTIWPNCNRARVVDFTRPLYYSPVFVYVKKGDKRFNANNLEALDSPKYSVSTIDGEASEVIARESFPKARKSSLPQLSDGAQLLLSVSTGKADVSLTEPANAKVFIKNNPGTIECVSDTKPIRIFANCLMFRRGQMEFKNMIDTALEQLINSGYVDKVISKYEPAPNSFFRVAIPYTMPIKKE
jgi:polar amino acid transport system substrate-binding protein